MFLILLSHNLAVQNKAQEVIPCRLQEKEENEVGQCNTQRAFSHNPL